MLKFIHRGEIMFSKDLCTLARDKEGRINLDEVVSNILLKNELKGKRKKFWMIFSDTKVLFKETNQNSYEDYAELLFEELCEAVGLPSAHYDLASCNDKIGVISYDFRSSKENFISGSILLKKYINMLEENDGFIASKTIDNRLYNNLNTIEKALALECTPLMTVHIMSSLDLLYGLDCLGLQVDRHWNNWGVLHSVHHGILLKRFAPQFDGGGLCGFNISKKKIHNKLNYLNKQTNLYQIQRILEQNLLPTSFDNSFGLRYDEQVDFGYFGVSRLMKAYIKEPTRFLKVIDCLLCIDPIDIVDNVEKRIHAQIPDDCAYWFIHIIDYNLKILQLMKKEIDGKEMDLHVREEQLKK